MILEDVEQVSGNEKQERGEVIDDSSPQDLHGDRLAAYQGRVSIRRSDTNVWAKLVLKGSDEGT